MFIINEMYKLAYLNDKTVGFHYRNTWERQTVNYKHVKLRITCGLHKAQRNMSLCVHLMLGWFYKRIRSILKFIKTQKVEVALRENKVTYNISILIL